MCFLSHFRKKAGHRESQMPKKRKFFQMNGIINLKQRDREGKPRIWDKFSFSLLISFEILLLDNDLMYAINNSNTFILSWKRLNQNRFNSLRVPDRKILHIYSNKLCLIVIFTKFQQIYDIQNYCNLICFFLNYQLKQKFVWVGWGKCSFGRGDKSLPFAHILSSVEEGLLRV